MNVSVNGAEVAANKLSEALNNLSNSIIKLSSRKNISKEEKEKLMAVIVSLKQVFSNISENLKNSKQPIKNILKDVSSTITTTVEKSVTISKEKLIDPVVKKIEFIMYILMTVIAILIVLFFIFTYKYIFPSIKNLNSTIITVSETVSNLPFIVEETIFKLEKLNSPNKNIEANNQSVRSPDLS